MFKKLKQSVLAMLMIASTTMNVNAVQYPRGTFRAPADYVESEHRHPEYRVKVEQGPPTDLVRGQALASGRIDGEFVVTLSPVKRDYVKQLRVTKSTRKPNGLGNPSPPGTITTPLVITAVNRNKDILGHVFCIEENTDIAAWDWSRPLDAGRGKYRLHTGNDTRVSNVTKVKKAISYAMANNWANHDMQTMIWYALGQATPIDNFSIKNRVEPFEKALRENHPDTNHIVDLFEYRDSVYDGQSLISFNFRKANGFLKVVKKDQTTNQALSGVRFKVEGPAIITAQGTVRAKEYTTTQDGTFQTDTLQAGEYTITEILPKETYRFSTAKVQRVTVTSNHTQTNPLIVNFTNEQQKMDFEIHKELPINPNNISKGNGVFEVRVRSLLQAGIAGQKQAGEVVGTYTADQNGIARMNNLPLGVYEVREKTAPSGTLLNNGLIVVTGQYQKDGNNIPEKTTRVTYDNASAKKVVEDKRTNLRTTLQTAFRTIYPNQTFNDSQLGLGVAMSSKPNAFPNTIALGRITIHKQKNIVREDTTTGNVDEPNITFEIKKGSVVVDTLVTNANGLTSSKYLPLGEYTVEQKTTTVRNGKDEVNRVEPFTVNLNQDGQVLNFELVNKPTWMKLKVNKYDSETRQLILQDGREYIFEIYDAHTNQLVPFVLPNGQTETRIVVDGNVGQVVSMGKLRQGDYYLKEVEGPLGYNYDPNHKIAFSVPKDNTGTIEVEGERVVNVDVYNDAQKGKLTINKQGEVLVRWQPMEKTLNVFERGKLKTITKEFPQAEVTLKLKNVKTGKYELVKTDENGIFERLNLQDEHELTDYLGKVLAKGTDIRVELPKISKEVQIREEGKPTQVTEQYYQPIYEKQMLPNAKFQLIAKEDIISKDGRTRFYYQGEALDIAVEDIVSNGTVYKKNDVVLGTPEERKAMNTTPYYTTVNGENTITNIPLGKYTFKELEAPLGYVLDETEKELSFTPQAKEQRYDIQTTSELVNARQTLSVKLNKKQVEKVEEFNRGNGYDGIFFGVYTKRVNGIGRNQPVAFIQPDENGIVTVDNLPSGEYYFVEKYAKDGYTLSAEEVDVSIRYEKGTKENIITILDNPIVNRATNHSVIIKKVDAETGKGIHNVGLKLIAITNDNKETKIQEFFTSKDGNTYELKEGTYRVVETEAQKGYVKPQQDEIITVFGSREVVITNQKTKAVFSKLDALTGERVLGATLKLVDNDGNVVKVDSNWHVVYDDSPSQEAVWVTTNEDKVIRGLEINKKYHVLEVEAPEGYILNTSSVIVDIFNMVEEQRFEFLNEQSPEISTVAHINGEKEANISSDMIFTDRVYYEFKHNRPLEEKEIRMVVMNKKTQQPYVDAKGNTLEKTVRFTPTERKGYIDISIAFDGTNLTEDTELVAFEKVSRNSIIIGKHENFEDKDQTVTLRKASFKTKVATHTFYKQGKVDIHDTITYINYTNGKKKFSGILMDADLKQPLLDKNGYPYISEVIFENQNYMGEITVTFKDFDTDLHVGKKVVVFETSTEFVNRDGKEVEILIGEHENFEDKDQTFEVKTPRLNTTATIDNKKAVEENGMLEMKDVIEYENVAPNYWYLVTTSYFNETETFKTKVFITEPNGAVEVKGLLDTFKHAGKKLTVIEKMERLENEQSESGVFVGEHKDKESVSQTFEIVKPSMNTIATINNQKEVHANGLMELKDLIEYDGYASGEYEFETTIFNHNTNDFLKDEKGNVLTFVTRTKIENPNGTVEVKQVIDTEKAIGKLTIFEKSYRIKGSERILMDKHEDKNSTSQTIIIKPKPTEKIEISKKEIVKTGEETNYIYLLVLLSLLGLVVFRKRGE